MPPQPSGSSFRALLMGIPPHLAVLSIVFTSLARTHLSSPPSHGFRPKQVVMTCCEPDSGVDGLTGTIVDTRVDIDGKLRVYLPSIENYLYLRPENLRALHKSRIFELGDRVRIVDFLPLPDLSGHEGVVVGHPEPKEGAVAVLVESRPFPIQIPPRSLRLILPQETPEMVRRRKVNERMVRYDIDDNRHFINRIDEMFPGGALETPWRGACMKLVSKLSKGLKPPLEPEESLYHGELGVIFAIYASLLTLQIPLRAVSSVLGDKMRSVSETVAQISKYRKKIPESRYSFLHGRPGAACVEALVWVVEGDLKEARRCGERVLDYFGKVRSLAESECNVELGRAGYLQCINILRILLNDPKFGFEEALEIVRQLIKIGRETPDSKSQIKSSDVDWKPKSEAEILRKAIEAPDSVWRPLELYYEVDEKCDLGALRGVLGILNTILLFPEELKRCRVGTIDEIRRTLHHIIQNSHSSANLRSYYDGARDRLVQWCSGAPSGISPLLHLITASSPTANQRKRRNTSKRAFRGILIEDKNEKEREEIRAFALGAAETLGEATDDRKWLDRARHFGRVALSRWEELEKNTGQSRTLFEGSAGAMFFFACLSNPKRAWFPGYTSPPSSL
ncbi:hypothetical protein AAMO2058_000370800 [Amorphochlora amoebiformis]